MEKSLFLNTLPFLTHVDDQVFENLALHYDSKRRILDALCMFSVGGKAISFYSEGSAALSERFQLSLFLLLGGSIDVPSLFFNLDGGYFFVDHTRIDKISVPKTYCKASNIPAAVVEFQLVQMRWFHDSNVSGVSSLEILSGAIATLNKHLQPDLLKHPKIPHHRPGQIKLSELHRQATAEVDDAITRTTTDSYVRDVMESWINLLRTLDVALTPHITKEDICASTMLAFPTLKKLPLLLSNPASSSSSSSSPRGEGAYLLQYQKRTYESIARSFMGSMMEPNDAHAVETYYDEAIREKEMQISECLDTLFGPSTKNTSTSKRIRRSTEATTKSTLYGERPTDFPSPNRIGARRIASTMDGVVVEDTYTINAQRSKNDNEEFQEQDSKEDSTQLPTTHLDEGSNLFHQYFRTSSDRCPLEVPPMIVTSTGTMCPRPGPGIAVELQREGEGGAKVGKRVERISRVWYMALFAVRSMCTKSIIVH